MVRHLSRESILHRSDSSRVTKIERIHNASLCYMIRSAAYCSEVMDYEKSSFVKLFVAFSRQCSLFSYSNNVEKSTTYFSSFCLYDLQITLSIKLWFSIKQTSQPQPAAAIINHSITQIPPNLSFLYFFKRLSIAITSSDKSFSVRTLYVILRFAAEVNSGPLIVCLNIFIEE